MKQDYLNNEFISMFKDIYIFCTMFTHHLSINDEKLPYAFTHAEYGKNL